MLGAPFDHPCGLKLFELELGAGPAAFKGGIAFFRVFSLPSHWENLT